MHEAQRQDEVFDIVDANDQVIGQSTRGEVHKLGLLHRAVHVFVYNAQGQMLLQRRSLKKDSSPGKWTSSCSGHVDAGEGYEIASVRELREELGIYIAGPASLQEILRHNPCRETGNEFVRVYKLIHTGTHTPDPAEVSETRWLDPQDITEWIAQTPSDFAVSFAFLWGEKSSL